MNRSLLSIILFSCCAFTTAKAVDYGVNLLVNGDAQNGGVYSATGDPVSISNWVVSPASTMSVVNYKPSNDSTGFPKTTDPGPPDRGNSFFAGGPDTNTSAYQDVDVSTNDKERSRKRSL
jgi:hypothetical protein